MKNIIAALILVSALLLNLTAFAGTIQLPETGLTTCYDTGGSVVTCAGSGQDGELRMGVAWPSPRFVDNGDQTVSDNLTGLVWSKDANPAASAKNWQGALDYIKTLNSANYRGYDDWRLPNRKELLSLINHGQVDNASWLNSQGFSGVLSSKYWSSSSSANNVNLFAWFVNMGSGGRGSYYKSGNFYVWPVRAGQFWVFGSLTISAMPKFAPYTDGKVSAAHQVEINNDGNSTIAISSISVSGVNAADFTVTTGGNSPCSSLNPTLASNTRCTILLNAIYATAGSKNANLTITTNGVGNNIPISSTVLSSPPEITSFTIPGASTNLTIPISTFTSTDNVGVTGYCLSETNDASGCTWSTTAPSSYTFSGILVAVPTAKTIYAFAKDLAGNVSASKSASTTITIPDTTAPTIDVLTLPATSTTLDVPVTAFTATDNVKVTGYCLTEAVSSAGCSWKTTVPTSYTFSSSGGKTLYSFAKDAVGNISARVSATIAIETIKPTISAFTIPAASSTTTVPITTLTATDNVGVSGYCLSETSDSSGCTWSTTVPTSYTFTSIGSKTLYAWAKDAAGNISASASATSTVDTKPTITVFSIPTAATSLTLPITTFTATDNIGVTGYCLKETNDPTGCSWMSTAPVNYTFSSSGSKTLYAWVKDTAGNISTAVSATSDVATTPTVTAFAIPATSQALSVPITAFTAFDNLAVNGYKITESSTPPLASDTDWSSVAPASYTFVTNGSKTLYAWAKDAAGNISLPATASVVVDTIKPTISAFTLPLHSSSLVTISNFTASDDLSGVGAYLLTTSATIPMPTDPGWSTAVPTSYTFASTGSKTLYAWAKDAVGNISTSASASVTIECLITATSDANGTITLPGESYYSCDLNRLYKIAPKPGFRIADVKVDGLSVGKISNYLFTSMATLGSHTIDATFEPDPFANWHQIAPGYIHTLAVRADGTMWAWGNNSGNQLGDGTTNPRYNPIRVTAYTDWQAVAAGPYHSLARRSNGNLYGWGDNTSGQLGTSGSTLPVLIDSNTDWQELAAAGTVGPTIPQSSSYSYARQTAGSFKQMGASPSGSLSAAALTGWVTLTSGISHAAAIRADGTLWSWGLNTKGQLGDSSITARSTPVQTGSANNWVQVAAGTAHTVGLQYNGTLWTWGDNSSGQLGTDQIPSYSASPVQIGSGQSWKAIAAGDYHTLALRSDGTIWAFGNNSSGQLGDGSGATTNFPVQVGTDSDWKSISAHGNLSYGIKNNNTLYVWGANSKGQLGDTTTIDKLSPVLVGTNTNSFVIAATSSNGGSISPSGAITAAAGTSKTFSIAPLVGWHISDVIVDGVSKGAITSHTFNSIIDRHTIAAVFAQNATVNHIITSGAGIGASISPNGTVVVADGTSQLFSISPQANYQISDVVVDGISQGPQTTYTFSNVKGNHTIQVSASMIDTTVPTGSISINAGALATTNNVVSLTLSATDAGGNLYQRRFSLDNVSWSSWEAYSTSRSYTLPAGDGTKNLYVQYRDTAGNISIAYRGTIILDTLSPTGSVSLNSGDGSTNLLAMTASLNASDGGSGVTQMQLSWDNVTWLPWEAYSSSKIVTASGASGTKTLYVRFKDLAGNVSIVSNDSIIFTPLFSLNLTVSGDGTVNSDPSGFSCGSTTCTTSYPSGTGLILMATTGTNFIFNGWSGACSGTGNCLLTINGVTSVTATFTEADKARIGTVPYASLTAAFAKAASGQIKARAIEFIESLSVALPTIFKGGWNAEFGSNSGSFTTLKGTLTIRTGSLTVEGLVIR